MNFRRWTLFFFSGLFIFTFCFVGSVKGTYAVNSLSFDQLSKNGNVGDSFKVGIMINADDSVNSFDVYMTFEDQILEIGTTDSGDFFKNITSSVPKPGTYYVGGYPEGTNGKKGKGTLAYVNVKMKKAGQTQLKFICNNASAQTSKLIVGTQSASNAIDCSSTGAQSLTVNIGNAVSGSGSGTTSTASNPTPTPANALPVVQPQTGGYTPGYVAPTRLPQTGAFDEAVKAFISGGLFLGFGGALKKLVER
jgi:hypothetical protein